MNNNLLSGVNYFIDGFILLFKPGIKRFVIIPVIINILLFIALFFFLQHFLAEFNEWFTHYLPSWLRFLATILWLLFFVSFFIIFIYLFVAMGNIVSAPFNSFLSEKVELYLTGNEFEQKTFMQNIQDVPHSIGRQFAILGYYLPRALALLICFFVPLVQTIVPILWFIFNAWYLSLSYLDYPTDNHRISLHDVRLWLSQNRWLSLGFGMSILIVAMIPFLNFFAIPAAVAGATKLWIKEN